MNDLNLSSNSKPQTESVRKILILFAHPVFQTSLLNKSLLNSLPNSQHVTVHDLYEHYPNFMIDVQREQQLLIEHDVIVFQHPLYWYSAPSLLKEWMDLVLEHGFAFGSDGNQLKDKQFISVITSGGDEKSYLENRCIRSLLKPYELTAELCQMQYLPPFVTYNALKIKAEKFDKDVSIDYMEQQTKLYQKLIKQLLKGLINTTMTESLNTINSYVLENTDGS